MKDTVVAAANSNQVSVWALRPWDLASPQRFHASLKWDLLTDELWETQTPWAAEMLLGPTCTFCSSLASASSPSFLVGYFLSSPEQK